MPSGLDPQQTNVAIVRSPFQRPQHWHPAFTGSGRGPVGPFGLSRLWLLPAPSRGLAHQARATVRPPPRAPLGRPAAQSRRLWAVFDGGFGRRLRPTTARGSKTRPFGTSGLRRKGSARRRGRWPTPRWAANGEYLQDMAV